MELHLVLFQCTEYDNCFTVIVGLGKTEIEAETIAKAYIEERKDKKWDRGPWPEFDHPEDCMKITPISVT